jgi:hydroxymethylglutaryl-CoA reductase
MGANAVNTIVEHSAPFILGQIYTEEPKAKIGIKILSNLCLERRAGASFKIPVEKMGWKNAKGNEVVIRILEAYKFAQMDPFRACTHNKGILNGIDAVAVATG